VYQDAQRPNTELVSGNYQRMLEELYRGNIQYFLSNHLPVDSPLWAAPIGQDGLAIVVHPDVDIRALTIDDLRAIYQGRLTNWSALGADPQQIIVYSREDGSGTRGEFDRMVMGYRLTTRNARIAASSQLVIDNVIRTPGGIGYVSLGYLDHHNVQTMRIDGVMPTPQTVADGRYPLRSTLFVVGLSEPDGITRQFIGWMQSREGQRIIAEEYAPLRGS